MVAHVYMPTTLKGSFMEQINVNELPYGSYVPYTSEHVWKAEKKLYYKCDGYTLTLRASLYKSIVNGTYIILH